MLRTRVNDVLSLFWLVLWVFLFVLALWNWSGKKLSGSIIRWLTDAAASAATLIHWSAPDGWADRGMGLNPPESHAVGWYYLYTAAFWIGITYLGILVAYYLAAAYDRMAGTAVVAAAYNGGPPPGDRGAPPVYAGATSFWEVLLSPRRQGISPYEAGIASGRFNLRVGLVLTLASLIPIILWIVVPLHWIFGTVGIVLLCIGLITCATGMATVSRTNLRRAQIEEDERLLELDRRRESWAYEHESNIKSIDRSHQRLLVEMRQPHDLQMKAQEMAAILAQMVSVAKSENKFEHYETILRRLERSDRRLTEDINNRNISDEEKNERIEAQRRQLVELAQRLIREL